jgi:hypothetical protein
MIHELAASLNAALETSASPEIATAARGESLFTRTVQGSLAELIKSARRVWDMLHKLMRNERETKISDRKLADLCGVGRRCVQKGLWFLEHVMGWITRWRHNGIRTIYLAIKWPTKPAKVSSAKPGEKPVVEQPAALWKRVSEAGWTISVNRNSPSGVQYRPNRPDPVPEATFRAMIRGREQDLRAYVLSAGRPARE